MTHPVTADHTDCSSATRPASTRTRPRSRGLWRQPTPRHPKPLPLLSGSALLLDADGLVELCSLVARDFPGDPLTHERVLASLVATARAGRRKHIRAAVAERLGLTGFVVNVLENLLLRTTQTDPVPPPETPAGGFLTHLLVHRAATVIDALGHIPCLLSTPTHDDFRVAWRVFVDRAEVYEDSRSAALPADVAVALGRLNRFERIDPDDLPTVRIQGSDTTLDEVVAHWLVTPSEATRLVLLPEREEANRWVNRLAARMQVAGEESTVHHLLGLDDVWSREYRPGQAADRDRDAVAAFLPVADPVIATTLGEIPPAWTLLPNHPARPAAWALHALLERGAAESLQAFGHVAKVAVPWGSVLSLVWLQLAGTVDESERKSLAAHLIDGWERCAVTPEDLLTAWHSRWRSLLDPSRLDVARTLIVASREGALALVWPLLSEIIDDLAGSRGFTGTTATLLEEFQPLVAEVVAAQVPLDLPEVRALAKHTSTGPGVTAARRIVASMPARMSEAS
ncbi:hypothetical protein [Arachnia propionica]|uniref:Uncharacterized protein n=1 Tax=Arachnia propionica TaxID=1750 RepID=A0A3P1WNT2_9ACTN|nr:hypothetical protein [Arachnia propionica]RRD48234.1 hypothetical protein EII35_13775 [Arachnia propionica]